VTPEDVVWSLEAWKAGNIRQANYYLHVVKAEVSGEREVTFTFDKPGNRELPQIVGLLVILPKHWWLANGPDGKPRDVAKTSLEPPLGSGPYRVKTVEPGRSLAVERVKDWWAADLPSERGLNNFDEIRYEYYRDRDVGFEGFGLDAVGAGFFGDGVEGVGTPGVEHEGPAAGGEVAGEGEPESSGGAGDDCDRCCHVRPPWGGYGTSMRRPTEYRK